MPEVPVEPMLVPVPLPHVLVTWFVLTVVVLYWPPSSALQVILYPLYTEDRTYRL